MWRFPWGIFLGWFGAGLIRRFVLGIGRKCRHELSFPWFFFGFFGAEKLTSELQSRENKCMAMYKKLHRWPECNALARRLLLKKWERIPAVLQKKDGIKIPAWLGMAFVVKIGEYQEAFARIALQSQAWGRVGVRTGAAAFYQAEFGNSLMQQKVVHLKSCADCLALTLQISSCPWFTFHFLHLNFSHLARQREKCT